MAAAPLGPFYRGAHGDPMSSLGGSADHIRSEIDQLRADFRREICWRFAAEDEAIALALAALQQKRPGRVQIVTWLLSGPSSWRWRPTPRRIDP